MNLQDLEEHHHKLLTTSIHNVEVFALITLLDCLFFHGKGHVIGNCPYRGNHFFGHPSFVPFSILMNLYPRLSYAFLVIPPSNFLFPFSLPPARLMPIRNPIVPNLSNQFQVPINYMYGSNIDPMGRMFTPWSMIGGGYVLGYHTHTIIVAPSIVASPMISITKGTIVRHPPERVLVLVLVMPQRTNLTKDQRLLTSVLSKPSLESVSVGMKPLTQRP